jgi:hypothetical protein
MNRGALARATLPRAAAPRVTLDSRDFAERAFLSRWQQSDFLSQAQPPLTRFRE